MEMKCVLHERPSVATLLARMGRLPTLQMPHATVHSSLVADAWLAWHSMPSTSGESDQQMSSQVRQPTEIHDMVSTDGAVVHNDIPGPQSNGIPLCCCQLRWLNRDKKGLEEAMHTFFTSNRFLSSDPVSPGTVFKVLAGAVDADGASGMSTSAMICERGWSQRWEVIPSRGCLRGRGKYSRAGSKADERSGLISRGVL